VFRLWADAALFSGACIVATTRIDTPEWLVSAQDETSCTTCFKFLCLNPLKPLQSYSLVCTETHSPQDAGFEDQWTGAYGHQDCSDCAASIPCVGSEHHLKCVPLP